MGKNMVLKVCSHKYAFSSNIPCETMVGFYKEEDEAADFFCDFVSCCVFGF